MQQKCQSNDEPFTYKILRKARLAFCYQNFCCVLCSTKKDISGGLRYYVCEYVEYFTEIYRFPPFHRVIISAPATATNIAHKSALYTPQANQSYLRNFPRKPALRSNKWTQLLIFADGEMSWSNSRPRK